MKKEKKEGSQVISIKGLERLVKAINGIDEIKKEEPRLCEWCKGESEGRKRCKDCKRLRILLDEYALSYQEYIDILKSQLYRCAICNEKFPEGSRGSHIDHCHQLSHVREILCSRCNVGLGFFKDNTARLRNAVKYMNGNEVTRTWWIQKELG